MIIVPLDGSAHALAALPVAKAMAEIQGVSLRVVHLAERVLPPREIREQVGLDSSQLRGTILRPAGGEAIARMAAEENGWVVMCSRTGAEPGVPGLGPVAEEVLRAALGPVLLVPAERGLGRWELRQVLVPHEGTPATAAAIAPAAALAARAGAGLTVLHVATAAAARPTDPGTLAAPHYLDQPQHEWPAWTREFLVRVCCLPGIPADFRPRLFVARGQPGAEIVRFAASHRVDLAVLSWRGELSAARAATLKAVVLGALCPVLILRGH